MTPHPATDATLAYTPETAQPDKSAPVPNNGATLDQPSRLESAQPEVRSGSFLSGIRGATDSSLLRRIDIPGYEILEELGRGGMGVVYKARQKGLNRLVALKMILAAEHAGQEHRARFQAEAEAVAQLQHPHIVQIYEVGEVEGRPFFSLEFIDGGNLAQEIKGEPQPQRHAAALMHSLAGAIAAAHAIGIIHRDLKPANILLGKSAPAHSGNSVPKALASSIFLAQHPYGIAKITDFGLAKKLEGASGQTQSGAIMGTPAYMSPEQAGGRVKEIGPWTDVYSLGAILYEMLTGEPPFVSESPLEVILKVIRDVPAAPHLKVPKLSRDLEIITMKCLEKEPAKRYGTALELADDLKRYLEGEPISARAASPAEKVRRWVRAHPTKAGLFACAAGGLLLLLGFGYAYNLRLQKEKAIAENRLAELDEEKTKAHERAIRLIVQNGTQFLQQGNLMRALPLFAEALKMEGGDAAREEMHRVRLAAVLRQCPMLVRAWFHTGKVADAAFSPDGQWAAAAGGDGAARLYKLEAGDGGADSTLEFVHPKAVTNVLFSPNGRWLATACEDGRARLWKLPGGKPIVLGDDDDDLEDITSLSFSPDGHRLLTTCREGLARVFDVETGEENDKIAVRHAAPILHGEFAPVGDAFLTASADCTARVWDGSTGKPLSPVLAHEGPVVKARFSPNGEKVVTASSDKTCRVWTVKTGEPFGQPIRLGGATTDTRFGPAGMQIATANFTGHARVWTFDTMDFRPMVVKHEAAIVSEAFSPDGQWLATAGDDNAARVWNAVTGEPVTPPLRHNGTVFKVRFSPDGGYLMTCSDDGSLRLWDLTDVISRSDDYDNSTGDSKRAAFSADRRFAATWDGRTATLRDSQDPDGDAKRLQHDGTILSLCFSPDGTRLLTTSADRTARVWNSATGEPVGPPLRHGSEIPHGAFSPDGARVATGSADNTARLWRVGDGMPLLTLRHPGTVARVAFSADGSCLVTQCVDESVRVWDAGRGELVGPILKPLGWVKDLVQAIDRPQTGWDLAPDRRPVELLVLLSKWLSSQSVGDGGELVSLDPHEMRAIQQALREKSPELLAGALRVSAAWQLSEVERAEAAKDWFAAAFHLGRLIARPDYAEDKKLSTLLGRLGYAQGELGNWKSAAGCFANSIRLGVRPDERLLLSAALASRKVGDGPAYRANFKKLVDRAGESAFGPAAARIAWIGLLDDSDELRKSTAQMIGRIGRSRLDDVSLDVVRGADLVRAGEFDRAFALLDASAPITEGLDIPRCCIFLGLCEAGRTNWSAADRWLQTARRWHRKNAAGMKCFERLEIELMIAELEAALDDG